MDRMDKKQLKMVCKDLLAARDINDKEALSKIFDDVAGILDDIKYNEQDRLDRLPDSAFASPRYDKLSDNVSDLEDAGLDIMALQSEIAGENFHVSNIKRDLENIVDNLEIMIGK